MLTCVVQSNCGALKLIRDLIDVYKWEKEANALSLESIDYSRLIKECVDRASLVSKQRGIHITIELLEITGVVRADYYAIERVLTNLLDNAIKFSPGGGNVVVRFFQSGNMENILEVEDHGAGIKPEDQCRLFKRFSQGVDGKRYSGGSGLGLYLCKQIVECHGGTIECVSQLNTSTIFRVRLPAANMMTQYDVKTLRGIHSRT
ncbi:MAG: HAMP domain-containing sensor histidine kinase [Candidatus Melainabacteria bacterium]|nr:HAMP domain-containing sensor histidine kinase [Candidatus Melainabacteria bacterium]